MKKILILSNHHAYTYNFRKGIIQSLLDNNYKVYLVLPYGEKVDKLIAMGCEFVDLPLDRRGKNPYTDLKLLKNYYKIIKKIKPDAVLSYTVKPNVYGGILTRILKIPFYPNITGLGSAIERKGIFQKLLLKLYKFSLRKATCIFFQNKANLRYFWENNIVKNNHQLIPGSGVNLEEFPLLRYPSNKITQFIFVSRIMKEKGIEELIEAASILKDNDIKCEIKAIGFVEEEYIAKAKKLNQRDIIQFHGRTNDVKSYVKESDAIILPSYHEGMSNVLLEAASMGRPILASNVPGCRETFEEGFSGFGFEPKNTRSLVQAMIKFIKLSEDKRKEMGLNGRKKMEKEFDREIVVESYIEEINKILY